MRTTPMSTSASACAALGGLIALAIAVGIGRFVYTPILPLMVDAIGLSKFIAGLVASANFAGYLAGALFAARPLPGSRRTWLLGALLTSALSTGAMGLTSSVALFLTLRFAGGVASALALIFASAMVLEVLAETNRPGLSSLLFAGVGVGIVVSAALVSALRADDFAWPVLWIASGALSIAGTLAVAMLIPERGGTNPIRSRGPALPADPALLRLIAAYGLFGFGYVITATFLVAMVRGNPAVRPLEPLIWVVFGLAAAPSVAVWTRLAGKLSLPGAFAIACLVEAAGVLLSVAWPSTAGLFLGAILVGGTFMGLTALGLIRARGLGSGEGHRVIALMTSAFGIGQIVGPSFAGALYDRLGSFGVPSAVAAAALALAALLARG